MATRVSDRRSEEFEPMCRWKIDECCNIAELDLQGFKKEQLKVMINHGAGILTITGERPLEKSITSCFRKEIKVSDDIKANEIRAKFSCGVLTITMPKKPPPVPELSQHCRELVPADRVGPPSLIDFDDNVVAIKPDEESATKYMAVGGIVGVVTFLVLAGACYCIKYYQLHCDI